MTMHKLLTLVQAYALISMGVRIISSKPRCAEDLAMVGWSCVWYLSFSCSLHVGLDIGPYSRKCASGFAGGQRRSQHRDLYAGASDVARANRDCIWQQNRRCNGAVGLRSL